MTASTPASDRLSLAYRLAEESANTVGPQLSLRASAVTYAGTEPAKAANYLRALADELEGRR